MREHGIKVTPRAMLQRNHGATPRAELLRAPSLWLLVVLLCIARGMKLEDELSMVQCDGD